MRATPRFKPGQPAPTEGSYAAIDASGEIQGVAVWRRKGEVLPELVFAGSGLLGYVRVGEAIATTTK